MKTIKIAKGKASYTGDKHYSAGYHYKMSDEKADTLLALRCPDDLPYFEEHVEEADGEGSDAVSEEESAPKPAAKRGGRGGKKAAEQDTSGEDAQSGTADGETGIEIG